MFTQLSYAKPFGKPQFAGSILLNVLKIWDGYVQEFVEARRTAALNNAPSCMWSPVPPLELKGVNADALDANAGFVTFGNVYF